MDPTTDQFLSAASDVLTYSYIEMLINMCLAIALGFVVATIYRITHKGLSYSQSFTLTILFVTFVVAVVMMVIGSSLARAFALVGALSIIRFRTVVKDTKDTAYVFAGLAIGMAAGTSNYFLAGAATAFLSALALITHYFNFGALYKSEFILRFIFDQKDSSADYLNLITQHAKRSNLLHMEPSGDGQLIKLTYDIVLREEFTPEVLTAELDKLSGVSEVVMIASKSDVDY